MEIVNFLAELWGFSLIIVCLSFLVKPHHVENIFAVLENKPALLILGMINVVLGVGSLLAYHTWDSSWKVVITIVGWLILIKGTSYLYIPETVMRAVTTWKTKYMNLFPIALVIEVVFGCVLVYFGMAL